MRALVTGGNGFIGSFLVERLIQQRFSVRCLVRKTSNLRWIQDLPVELVYGELRETVSLAHAVKDVDIVFHLAGVTRGRSESDYVSGNYDSTVNLLTACESRSTIQQFIFVSSQAAGGPSFESVPITEEQSNPVSAYGRAKRRAEEAVLQEHPFATTVIRPPSVYGPRDKDFFVLFKQIQNGLLPMVGRGEQKISIIYIDDLIDGIMAVCKKNAAYGELFYMCGYESVSFWQLTSFIATVLSKKPFVVRLPLWVVAAVSGVAEGVARFSGKTSILNRDKVNELRQPSWLCTSEKARELLDFEPKTSLIQGLQQTAQWYRDSGWL